MATLKERIIELLQQNSGLSDREITDIIKGRGEPQQAVNQACRSLEKQGIITRRKRSDSRIGNHFLGKKLHRRQDNFVARNQDPLSEDAIKAVLQEWLIARGVQVELAWGKTKGVDIEATQGDKRWMIEVKGCGSSSQMRGNYFLTILGQTLQRMDDPDARYSIALPDLQRYRNLWQRLPVLAKSRTGITVLFVDEQGSVTQLS